MADAKHAAVAALWRFEECERIGCLSNLFLAEAEAALRHAGHEGLADHLMVDWPFGRNAAAICDQLIETRERP